MKWMRPLLIFVLIIQISTVFSQSRFSIGINTALDYVSTPEVPSYQSKGYGDPLSIRYGLDLGIKILDRVRLGVGMERYYRKEVFECVYFPTPDGPAQAALYPFINNPDYGCDYRSDSRIDFLEIPITAYYDFWKNSQYGAYLGLGYGLQYITRRSTTLVNQQTAEVSVEQQKNMALASNNSLRFHLGGERMISQKIRLLVSLTYRADSFRFDYQSLGLNAGLRFSI